MDYGEPDQDPAETVLSLLMLLQLWSRARGNFALHSWAVRAEGELREILARG